MFGRESGFDGPPMVVEMEGAVGREKRAEEVVGERCSAEEDTEELERTEKRGCG